MPAPMPITKRASSRLTRFLPNAMPSRPTTLKSIPRYTSERACPRSASGASSTWAANDEKKPAATTMPSWPATDPVVVAEVVERGEHHAVAGGEQRRERPKMTNRSAAHDRRGTGGGRRGTSVSRAATVRPPDRSAAARRTTARRASRRCARCTRRPMPQSTATYSISPNNSSVSRFAAGWSPSPTNRRTGCGSRRPRPGR